MKTLKNFLMIAVLAFAFIACENTDDSVQYTGDSYMPVPSASLKSTSYTLEVEPIYFNELPANLTNGLVCYYPLDGNADDMGPNSLHGTVTSGEYELGIFNDPADSTCIVIEDSPALTFDSAFSVCIWYNYNSTFKSINYQSLIGKPMEYPTTSGNNQSIFSIDFCYSDYDPFNIGIFPLLSLSVVDTAGQNLNITYTKLDATRDGIDLIKGWHFVVMTLDLTEGKELIKCFVDGIKRFEWDYNTLPGSTFSVLADSEQPMYIGRAGNLPYSEEPGYFHGTLDQVMNFNRALTDEEVYSLYSLRIR